MFKKKNNVQGITSSLAFVIKLRRDTMSNWLENNPVLAEDELAIVEKEDGKLFCVVGDGKKPIGRLELRDSIPIFTLMHVSATSAVAPDSYTITVERE